MIKRIAISGAPGTGKTCLINGLSMHGYKCHAEVSREIIAEQFKIGGDITPWKDLDAFSELVIDERIKQFKQAKEEIEFFDRTIIDSFAYLLKDTLPITKKWDGLAKEYRYSKIAFITPPWESIYKSDSERMEDFETATSIHEFMIKAYELYDYEIVLIPKVSVSERIKFILNHIEYARFT